jgi:hypothetical protein
MRKWSGSAGICVSRLSACRATGTGTLRFAILCPAKPARRNEACFAERSRRALCYAWHRCSFIFRVGLRRGGSRTIHRESRAGARLQDWTAPDPRVADEGRTRTWSAFRHQGVSQPGAVRRRSATVVLEAKIDRWLLKRNSPKKEVASQRHVSHRTSESDRIKLESARRSRTRASCDDPLHPIRRRMGTFP